MKFEKKKTDTQTHINFCLTLNKGKGKDFLEFIKIILLYVSLVIFLYESTNVVFFKIKKFGVS